jgi:hypothetical protein
MDLEKGQSTHEQSLVKERPADVEIPEELERGGIAHQIPSQFKANVSDDSGKQLIQTPQTQTITIQIPASQKQLEFRLENDQKIEGRGGIKCTVKWT